MTGKTVGGLMAALAASLATWAIPGGAAENRLTLAADGHSDYVIVVAADALPARRFAASELQLYLEKAAGVKLPIATAPAAGKKAIFVGDSPAARQLGMSSDGLKPEGFLIKTAGDSLALIGKDTPGDPRSMHWRSAPQTGTLYAVYDFLERCLGVRWFVPGPLGEVVPKTAKVEVGEINLRDAPGFVSRDIGTPRGGGNMEDNLWQRRNKAGHSLITEHSHNWAYILPLPPSPKGWPAWMEPKQPRLDHPEYYAMVDGRRVLTHAVALDPIMSGQVCTGNPDVVNIFAEAAVEHLERNPDKTMFSVSPNDGGGFCECPECRALDVELFPSGRPVLTDRIFAFYNQIAGEVERRCPAKGLGCYAYSYFAAPPKRVVPHRNLYIWNVHNGAGWTFADPKSREQGYADFRAWSKLSDNMFFYSYYQGLQFPLSTTATLGDLFRFLKSAGAKGAYLYAIGSWGGSPLDHYLTARLMWDPSLSAEALADDYYDKFFGGETGARMREYDELLWQATREFSKKQREALMRRTDVDDIQIPIAEILDALYGGIRAKARGQLDQALALAPDETVKARVRLASDTFRLAELTLDALAAYKSLEKDFTPENCTRFKRAVDAREKLLDSNQDALAFSPEAVREMDRYRNLPVTKKIAEYFASMKGKRKSVECHRANVAPIIDGRPDDACWQDAVAFGGLADKDDAAPSAVATEGRMLYDARRLYLRVVCSEPKTKAMEAFVTGRDGKVWEENELELFFDINREGKRAFQFALNNVGGLFDQRLENGAWDLAWNADWQVKLSVEPQRWTVEMAIPFKDLSGGTPTPGDIWGFNLCRVRKVAGEPVEYSAFSPTFGGFFKPDKFADLIFK